MQGSTLATLLIFYVVALGAGYWLGWRWLNGRFGYALDGKSHIALFIFFAPFVVAIIGVVYLITSVKDKSNGTKGGSNEIDI